MQSFIIAHTPDRMQGKWQNRQYCVPLKARETWLPSIGHALNGHKSPRTVNKSDRQHNCSALKPLRWLYYIFSSPDGINQVYTPPRHRSLIHHPLPLTPHWAHVLHARLHSTHSMACHHLDFTCIVLQPVWSIFLSVHYPVINFSPFQCYKKDEKKGKQEWALTVCSP